MTADEIVDPPVSDRRVSGKGVVGGMVLFGLLVTVGMYAYWELYERPFRGVQSALAAEFPKSSPRVIGGRHKSHKAGSPLELRVVMRLDVDPSDPQHDTKLRQMANSIVGILKQELPVDDYDRLSIFLVHRPPERVSLTWSLTATPMAFPLPEAGPFPADVENKLIRAEPN